MIEIREIGADELERWMASRAVSGTTAAAASSDYVDWKRQAEDMAWFVASRDGEDAGAALAYVGWHSKPGTGHGEVFVLHEHRGAGVGSALYERIARVGAGARLCHARDIGGEDDAESLAWVDRRGFREVGPQLAARARPDGDRGAGDRPTGGRRDRDLGGAARAGAGHLRGRVRGVPRRAGRRGHADGPVRGWLSKDMQGDGDRPEATFVALVDGEVVGYAKLSFAKSDTKVAYHDMTGVKRAFRGRGIAAALKRTEIRWAKEAGYEKLETANEVRNEPIRRLNERHGYDLQPGLVVLRATLAGPD